MINLKDFLNLSDKGYKELKKAVFACTLTNLALILPFCVTVMVFQEIILAIQTGALNTDRLWMLWGIGVLAAVLVFFCAKNDYRKTYITSYSESNETRIRIAEHLCKMPMSFYNSRDLTEVTTNIMSDCSGMESMLSSTIPPLIANVISSVITCILLALFDWRLALSVFVTIPLAFGIIAYSKKMQKRLFKKQVNEKLKASAAVQEYIEGIKVVKSCNVEGNGFDTLNRALLAVKKVSVKVELVVGIFMSSATMVLQAGIALTVFVGCMLLTNGDINVVTLLMFFLMATRVYGPFVAILGQLSKLMNLDVVTERMRKLQNSPVMTGDDIQVEDKTISLDDVHFSYNNEEVIKGVSLKIEEGSVNAFVGPSGSGKSTLAKLIARFYDVDSGKIYFGKSNVKNISPESLMKNFSFVFQDVILFNDTILNNIKMGNENISDEEAIKAAKAAYCDEFVSKLPDGYNTVLGENGNTLSGGERQRISIARALIKNAPIIILDEATASLDPENEVFVQKAIAGLVKNKTVIMIAHRLKTVVDADKIFVLENGLLTESGTHEGLLQQNGTYSRLYANC